MAPLIELKEKAARERREELTDRSVHIFEEEEGYLIMRLLQKEVHKKFM